MREKRSWAWRLAEPIVRLVLLMTTRREWVGGEGIPASGGCLIVLNHVSYVDPLTSAHLVYDHGRLPHYLAKSSLFRNRALARFFTAAGQIPVERLSKNAAGAFDAHHCTYESGGHVLHHGARHRTDGPRLSAGRPLQCVGGSGSPAAPVHGAEP